MCDTQALCICDSTRAELRGEKDVPFVHVLFFLSDAVPFFLKQIVLPLGPLATLARLHDHIRQLLHLEMRTISVIWKCCFILHAL